MHKCTHTHTNKHRDVLSGAEVLESGRAANRYLNGPGCVSTRRRGIAAPSRGRAWIPCTLEIRDFFQSVPPPPTVPAFSISRMREIYNQTAVCRSAALPLLLRVQEEEEAAHARLPAVDLRAGTPDNPPPAPLPSPQGRKRARRRSRRKKKKKVKDWTRSDSQLRKWINQ